MQLFRRKKKNLDEQNIDRHTLQKPFKPLTASPNVHILEENFFIPQLNRYRRIWIYLPDDYYNSDAKYPVLYMQDGQNLFDEATAFAGEWGVDKTLNHLFTDQSNQKIIVVGIDNGSEHRLGEYTPWKHPKLGGGEAGIYLKFMVKTLKPYIDAHFRTLKNRENTGIMGSSLGGLLVFYAGLKYAKVFGKVGVFSPSFWFSHRVFDMAKKYQKKLPSKFYFLAGAHESASLVPDTERMIVIMREVGFTDSEIRLVIKADGTHSEWFWRREFADAYRFLFKN